MTQFNLIFYCPNGKQKFTLKLNIIIPIVIINALSNSEKLNFFPPNNKVAKSTDNIFDDLIKA